MKRKHFLPLVLFLTFSIQNTFSQTIWTENFNDSNFTINPAWGGNTANFIVNGQKQLQLSAPAVATNSVLYTASKTSLNATWEFWVKLDFNPSTSNFAQVFFMSTTNSIASTEGYYLQLGGGTGDKISLYKRSNGQNTLLAASADGLVGKNINSIKLKVLRDSAFNFTLLADTASAGYFQFGNAADSTLKSSSFFMLNCIYTSTRSNKFSFDDFAVNGEKYTDTQKPGIISAAFANASRIDLTFSEVLDSISARKPGNYNTTTNILAGVTWSKTAPKLVSLNYQNPFTNGQNVALYIESVEDLAGNEMKDTALNLSFYHAVYRDIVINEILADPTPQVALPDIEFVELYNKSNYQISLGGWKFVNDGDTLLLPNYTLHAKSFVILFSNSAPTGLDSLPNIRLPSSTSWLKNDGESLLILDENKQIIDAFRYSVSIFGNSAKSAGGWSLEQIESDLPCSETTNWSASADVKGGTPARKNNPERNFQAYETHFLHAIFVDARSLILNFDHALLPENLPVLSSNLGIDTVLFSARNPTEIAVIFTKNITQTPTTLFIENSAGCAGSLIADTITFSLPTPLDSGDVVLNEILFNPKTAGVDFVELWNTSDKTILLNNLQLANLNEDFSVKEQFVISTINVLFPHKSYVVLSTNTAAVCSLNQCAKPKHFLQIAKMPSLPDAEGNLALSNKSTTLFEYVFYSEKWQHTLLSNPEGVSLERINPGLPSAEKSSWHSASSTVNYATPGFVNSQFSASASSQQQFWVNTTTLSPNNDGQNDVLILGYNLPQSSVINATVFGMNGIQIATIANNLLAEPNGEIIWDGSTESGLAPTGICIILAEWFSPDGASGKSKITIAISR